MILYLSLFSKSIAAIKGLSCNLKMFVKSYFINIRLTITAIWVITIDSTKSDLYWCFQYLIEQQIWKYQEIQNDNLEIFSKEYLYLFSRAMKPSDCLLMKMAINFRIPMRCVKNWLRFTANFIVIYVVNTLF